MKKQFDLNLLAAPQFSVTLPSNGQTIKVRSLLMKEYKNLFIAQESGNKLDAVEQCLESAILTEGVDLLSMPVGDVEFVFLQIYMASTGNNTIPIKYRCDEKIDGVSCKEIITTEISIESAYVPKTDLDYVVKLNDSVAIKMRPPTSRDFDQYDIKKDDGLLKCVINCIESVMTDDTVYTKEELSSVINDIMDSLNGSQFAKMVQCITSAPRIMTYVDTKCPKCHTEHKLPVVGLDDFFM